MIQKLRNKPRIEQTVAMLVETVNELIDVVNGKKDTTDECRLEFVDGFLTCTYNHKAGDNCLMYRNLI